MNLKYSARALLVALLEEVQEEEEDEEDLLLLSKLSEVGKKHSRYQKNYINSLSPTGKKTETVVSLVKVCRVQRNQYGNLFMKVIRTLGS